MDKMREEFEAFYESYMLGEGRRIEYIKNEIASFKSERNKYRYSDVQEFWVVWKASRAALCVELPSRMNQSDNDYYACGFDNALYAAEIKMEMAGVSYK